MSAHEDKLFETYKLHAELTERVASSRLNLNKLYSGLVTSIIAVYMILSRLYSESDSSTPNYFVRFALPTVGCLISISWLVSIWNITGHLKAKNKTLRKLEAKLPFPFLEIEHQEFQSKKTPRNSTSSMIMPGLFLLICIVWIVIISCR